MKKELNSADLIMRTKIGLPNNKAGITPVRSVQASMNWLRKKGYVKPINKPQTNEQ